MITTSIDKFEKEWKATGKMIKDGQHTLIQTYEHPRFPGLFTQHKVNSPFGQVIEMHEVK